jgi:hypothetical protein
VPAGFEIAMPLELTLIGPDHELLEPSADLSSPQAIVDRIGLLEQLGVAWTAVPPQIGAPMRTRGEFLEHLEWWASEIVGPLR